MPKSTGPHRDKVLKSTGLKKLGPGRHSDGGGLYLEVEPSGSRRWTLRVIVQRRRRDIGLGSASTVPLSEAREIAAQMRKTARAGGDPLADRRVAVAPTFEVAARECFAAREDGFRNEKHKAQWISSLETYAFPKIGTMPVDKIGAAEMLGVLTPIWQSKRETARRVRQRIHTVLQRAKAMGYRKSESPNHELKEALPRHTDKQKHHAALAYGELPELFGGLSKLGGIAPIALQFAILTAARTGEVLGATWAEVDLEKRVWIIPAHRMKKGLEHRVPLAPVAVTLLSALRGDSAKPDGFVFPGRDEGRHLSNMAMLTLLQRQLGRDDLTVHGFRSSFRDWTAEQTGMSNEVAEHALAHVISDKAEAAYRRSDLFEKRRVLMERWANYCTSGAKVVPLRVAS